SGFHDISEYLRARKGQPLSVEGFANPKEMFRIMMHIHQRNEAFKLDTPMTGQKDLEMLNQFDSRLGSIFDAFKFFPLDNQIPSGDGAGSTVDPVRWLEDLVKSITGAASPDEPLDSPDSFLSKIYHPPLYISYRTADEWAPVFEIPGFSSVMQQRPEVDRALTENLNDNRDTVIKKLKYNQASQSTARDPFLSDINSLIGACFNEFSRIISGKRSIKSDNSLASLYQKWYNVVQSFNDWGMGFVLSATQIQQKIETLIDEYKKAFNDGYEWFFQLFEKKEEDEMEDSYFDFEDARIWHTVLAAIFGGSSVLVLSAVVSFVIDFVLVIIDIIYLLFIGLIAYVQFQLSFVMAGAGKTLELLRAQVQMQVLFFQQMIEVLEALRAKKDHYWQAIKANGFDGLKAAMQKDFDSVHRKFSNYFPPAVNQPISLEGIYEVIDDLITSVISLHQEVLGSASALAKGYIYVVGFVHGIYAGIMRQIVAADYKKMGIDFMNYLWEYFVYDFKYFNSMFLNYLCGWDKIPPAPKLSPEALAQRKKDRDITNYSFWGAMGLGYVFLFNIGWFFGPLIINIILLVTGVGEIELLVKGIGWISKGVGQTFKATASVAKWFQALTSVDGFIGKIATMVIKYASRAIDWVLELLGTVFSITSKVLTKIFKSAGDGIFNALRNALDAIGKEIRKLANSASEVYKAIDDPLLKSVQKTYDTFMLVTLIPVMLSAIFASPAHIDPDKQEERTIAQEIAMENQDNLSMIDRYFKSQES
ncbi:MAG: hypothetical protein AAFO69_03520, partial [Bacteroidota bacterium]